MINGSLFVISIKRHSKTASFDGHTLAICCLLVTKLSTQNRCWHEILQAKVRRMSSNLTLVHR